MAGERYPVWVDAQHLAEYNRFLPLVKWLLVLPHLFVLVFLSIGVFFAKLVAFFAVLITGRYPRGIFDFVVGVLRWSWHVSAYVGLLNDDYPPFSMERDGSYPAQLEVEYPDAGIDRWRPLVQWLLILPYAIVAAILRWVAAIVILIGVFVILFTGKLPRGMFDLILIPARWSVRAFVYGAFMVDRYPPLQWEEPAPNSTAVTEAG